MGRRAHKPDPSQRRQVQAMAGYGIPEADIGRVIGIDAKTLRKHYREELDTGTTKATVKVAESLYRKAIGDGHQSVAAAIFWLKTRAHWSETQIIEHAVVSSEPMTQEQWVEQFCRTAIDVTPTTLAGINGSDHELG